ncbi:MAG: glutaredoxin family protein [Actinomycetes bacterium]
MISVAIYSRTGCHLCHDAIAALEEIQKESPNDFSIEVRLIDGNVELERKYGESIPVILIDEQPHDFWRVNPERFKKAIAQL